MLASLPIRRRDIVTAKYWGIIMFTILAFLTMLLWLPVYFAFGARIIQIIEYIIAFALAVIPIFFLRNQEDPHILLDHLYREKNLYWEGGICLVSMFISWIISILVYGRRNI
ncbi:ABC-2 transporter permease [Cohnella sp. NL03-T5]|nr:ABC-2 transporter permease [Cohnella silvisoli]